MYCTVPNKRIHMQCSIPPLQPNKRIGIVISFHLHLFQGIVIHFPNGIDISRTKRGLSVDQTEEISIKRVDRSPRPADRSPCRSTPLICQLIIPLIDHQKVEIEHHRFFRKRQIFANFGCRHFSVRLKMNDDILCVVRLEINCGHRLSTSLDILM
jgi:hypothetical protein